MKYRLNARWCVCASVTSKKSPNVYKSCPNMISLEKLKIFTPLFGQISCYQRLCKVAQSLINCPICSHWSVHCFISEEVLFFLLRNGLNKAARICVTIFHSHNGPIVPAGGIVLSCVAVQKFDQNGKGDTLDNEDDTYTPCIHENVYPEMYIGICMVAD